LNVSWLKKNELDFKRNMADLRDSIKANWSTTGQELTKDIRQFWQTSRPASPARTPTQAERDTAATATSPSALSRLSHLEIPGRAQGRESSDFAAGYSLGLIGGVRSWVSGLTYASLELHMQLDLITHANELQMARSQRNLNDSRPQSPSGESSSDEQMEASVQDPPRGRKGKQSIDEMDTRA
jgi:choline-phosphate cytidylyltransferase